uniref:Uncharacterized protein n=1 Tax=Poecilia mexicana TaxID=48701 RepID=A0A3B3Y0M6_9TELE
HLVPVLTIKVRRSWSYSRKETGSCHESGLWWTSVLFFCCKQEQELMLSSGTEQTAQLVTYTCREKQTCLLRVTCFKLRSREMLIGGQVSYKADRPQWAPALSPAVVNTDRPIRETVGVMVSGPMYSNSRPGNPEKPITTSTRLDMIMAP